jgi:4-diphosphocytidyl-2C-methyl-D-erythritol kinase
MVLLAAGTELANKTASMYSAISQTSYTRGALTRKLEARIRGGGDVPAQFLFNAFDDVARTVLPDVSGHWEAFESLGAREVHLAGSGPTLYAPVAKKEVGTAMQLLLSKKYGWPAFLVSAWQPVGGEPWEP